MTDATAGLRRTIYLLLGTLGVALMLARISAIEAVFEPSRYASPPASAFGVDRIDPPYRIWPATRPEPVPFFGSNDKSRWCTVRALVDHGTFVIGHRDDWNDPKTDHGIVFEDGWSGIDKVMNPATGDYYSSKPPLFAVMVAAEYWFLKNAFNLSIVKDRWPVVMIVLATVNVLPFACLLVLYTRLIEQHGTTDFGNVLAFATLALGTFLTTFSNTLNNHLPGSYCAAFALYPLLRYQHPNALQLMLSGFFAAMTATFELPAASFTALLTLTVIAIHRSRAAWMLPGLLVPTLAFFAANYMALGQFRPAYSDFGGPWYNYPGSHWARLDAAKAGAIIPGIDFAQESRGIYLFHCVFGHHGWFSLSPVWFIGCVGLWTRRGIITEFKSRSFTLSTVAYLTLVLTLTLLVFFVYIQKTNNYGGGTSGLRWLFWLIPLWVLCVLAGADRIARRWPQRLSIALLGISAFSAFYPVLNPWKHPWPQVVLERLEIVNYERTK